MTTGCGQCNWSRKCHARRFASLELYCSRPVPNVRTTSPEVSTNQEQRTYPRPRTENSGGPRVGGPGPLVTQLPVLLRCPPGALLLVASIALAHLVRGRTGDAL